MTSSSRRSADGNQNLSIRLLILEAGLEIKDGGFQGKKEKVTKVEKPEAQEDWHRGRRAF